MTITLIGIRKEDGVAEKLYETFYNPFFNPAKYKQPDWTTKPQFK